MDHSQHSHPKPERPAQPRLPAMICRVASTVSIDAAFGMLLKGGDTLDAAMHVCKTQEDDPKDHTCGLGGLPNSAGEVQLDACCIHGPSRRSAAVGAVSGIRNPSMLARTLMDRTANALVVGSDAQTFAVANGFKREELLTDRTRKNYALWKTIAEEEARAGSGQVGPGQGTPMWPKGFRGAHTFPKSQEELDTLVHRFEPLALEAGLSPETTWRAVFDAVAPQIESLYVGAIGSKGELSLVCTSSGQPWRMPGLVSDVATIGAGCFVDPEVGSVGSSGTAEANIQIAGAHTIAENMRMGMTPEEAGMDALHRMVRWCGNNMNTLRFVQMVYYILRRDGAYGSVSLWRGDSTGHTRQFTIMDGEYMRRTEDCKVLFDCGPLNGCSA